MGSVSSHERGEKLDFHQVENDVLTFWFGSGPEEKRDAWFQRDPDFDAEIVVRFTATYEAATAGRLDDMARTPLGCLALVIVLDQFPRNMFREDPRAFATDAKALALARNAIEAGFDAELTEYRRQFLYMPYQHSEDIADQKRSVELFAQIDKETLGYAVRHLEVVERFGRFPHRNAILGRDSTVEEIAFLKEPNSSF